MDELYSETPKEDEEEQKVIQVLSNPKRNCKKRHGRRYWWVPKPDHEQANTPATHASNSSNSTDTTLSINEIDRRLIYKQFPTRQLFIQQWNKNRNWGRMFPSNFKAIDFHKRRNSELYFFKERRLIWIDELDALEMPRIEERMRDKTWNSFLGDIAAETFIKKYCFVVAGEQHKYADQERAWIDKQAEVDWGSEQVLAMLNKARGGSVKHRRLVHAVSVSQKRIPQSVVDAAAVKKAAEETEAKAAAAELSASNSDDSIGNGDISMDAGVHIDDENEYPGEETGTGDGVYQRSNNTAEEGGSSGVVGRQTGDVFWKEAIEFSRSVTSECEFYQRRAAGEWNSGRLPSWEVQAELVKASRSLKEAAALLDSVLSGALI